MKSLLKFLAAFVLILLASALLAPLLFKVLPYKFERIFNRLVMIFTLAAVFWAVARGKLQFPAEAISPSNSSAVLLLMAFSAGFLTLVILSLVKILAGIVILNIAGKDIAEWLKLFSLSLVSALVIGFLEECFFRGFVFVTLVRRYRWAAPAAIVATNVFYALVHFLGGKKPFVDNNPDFSDGLRLVFTPFQSLADWQPIMPAAIGLFIFGCILSFLFLETKSLYPCIGLHMGCVFFLKLDGSFFFQSAGHQLFFGTSRNYDGIMGWAFLLIMGYSLYKFIEKKGYKVRTAVVVSLVLLGFLPGKLEAAKSWDVYFQDEKKDQEDQKADDQNPKQEVTAVRTASPLSPAAPDDSASSASQQEGVPAEEPTESGADTAVVAQRSPLRDSAQESTPSLDETVQTEGEKTTEGEPSLVEVSPFTESQDHESPQATVSAASNLSMDDKLPAEERPEAPALPLEARPVASLAPEGTSRMRPVAEDGEAKQDKESAAVPSSPQTPTKEAPVSSEPGTGGLPPSMPVQNRGSSTPAKQSSGAYVFSAHLQTAEVSQWKEDSAVLKGVWDKNAFVFPSAASDTAIHLLSAAETGAGRPLISFPSIPATTRRLLFRDVPAGSVFKLRYLVPGTLSAAEKGTTLYLRVWVGRNPVTRLSLPVSSGFKETEISMGVVSFLKHRLPVALDLTSSGTERIPFAFDMEIEKS